MTSHDCVMKVRKLLHIKKVGHTGTLDPNVEGVLPICIGEATKIIPFLSDLQKVYIAEIALGKSTTTEDTDGEVVEVRKVTQAPSDEEVKEVLQKFTGKIEQTPPIYSAIKVKGKRLYEYARKGIDVERPVRHVTVFSIEKLPLNSETTNERIRMKVTCSKGTYIRTLCVDIGEKLGYPAHMAYLQRIESDSFHLDETYTFSDIQQKVNNHQDIEALLLPIDQGLRHLYTLNVDEDIKEKVLYGQKLPLPKKHIETNPFKVMFQDKLLAIYEKHPKNKHEIKPVRVFNL